MNVKVEFLFMRILAKFTRALIKTKNDARPKCVKP